MELLLLLLLLVHGSTILQLVLLIKLLTLLILLFILLVLLCFPVCLGRKTRNQSRLCKFFQVRVFVEELLISDHSVNIESLSVLELVERRYSLTVLECQIAN